MNLTPFLLFDGNCDEAMAFYQSCLGGELTITRLGDTPMGNHAPPEQQHKVTYAA
jgi:PhnB protein